MMSKDVKDYTASLAGKKETWREWAGRTEGGDGFHLSDIVGNWRKKRKHRQTYERIKRRRETCPVCYTEIQNEEEWFITSSCVHATCIDCAVGYLKSQINDNEQYDALKCSMCSEALIEADTIKLFRRDQDLVQAWDTKMRNNALRKALHNFRPCPHCENTNHDGGFGGGFVSAECLESIILERNHYAESLLKPLREMLGFIMVAVSIYILSIDTVWSNIIIMSWIWSYRGTMLVNLFLAIYKQSIILQSIEVGCPCCTKSFVLNAEAELTATAQNNDGGNEKWIREHSRPCPGCSSPVEKNGGCNHMRCSRCNTKFCWVCMKVRTKCGSFNCVNGIAENFQSDEGGRLSYQNEFFYKQQAEFERYKRDATEISGFDFLALNLFVIAYFWFSLKSFFWLSFECIAFFIITFFITFFIAYSFMLGLGLCIVVAAMRRFVTR